MRRFLETIRKEMEQGHELVLVTIVASSGSTPRKTGARMLVGENGRITGTIGGGAVELRSEKIAARMLKEKSSAEYSFILTKNDVMDLGMVCGGDVNVYFCFISPDNIPLIDILEKAEGYFALDRNIWFITELSNGCNIGIYTKEDGIIGACGLSEDDIKTNKPSKLETENGVYYVEQINYSGYVYIIGGGHVAQELQPLLTHLGFRCIVVDNREQFATKELFPTADDVILSDISCILDRIDVTENDYFCIMTSGHAYDMIAEAQALKTPACYIGVIGSARKTASVNARLREMGYTDDDLARITTPIGIKIEAETPAEIAVSIAAQLIDHRSKLIKKKMADR